MKYSLNWIKRYIDIDIDCTTLFEKLSMCGDEVEGYEEKLSEISNIVIAKIVKIEKHPSADKLHYCDVTDGKINYKIVCGAQNIEKGNIIPLAKIGATLPKGIKIKKSKIRGIESEGMLCSQKELGFGSDHSGIFILNDQYKIGTDFKKYFDDIIFEIEVTPNRPDLLSHYGLSREIGVILFKDAKPLEIEEEIAGKFESPIKVEIRDNSICSFYSLLFVKNIENNKTPDYIKQPLESLGLSSKNLLVDISNYNLLETGHPTHFFDADKIEGNIIVRFAKKGEKCITIDERERELIKSDLVIADEKKIVAIAGIMGCKNSEVDENTKNMAIESAIFNPVMIRRTKRRLEINSDAAYRFERGIDTGSPNISLKRILYLLKKYTSYEGISFPVTVSEKIPAKTEIVLKKENVDKVLGTNIKLDVITKILRFLGFRIEKLLNNSFKVIVPRYRELDVKREIDLIEEVGRIYSYDNIEEKRPYINGKIRRNKFYDFKNLIRNFWAARSAYNVMTLTVSEEELYRNYGYDGQFMKIKNPLNINQNVFAPLIFPRLVRVLIRNLKYKPERLNLFEIGRVFDEREQEKLSLLMYGNQFQANWLTTDNNNTINVQLLKGELVAFFDYIGIENVKFVNCDLPYFLSGNSGKILIDNEEIGYLGRLVPEKVPSNRVEYPILIAELSIKPLFKDELKAFRPFSPYPVVERDISIVFKKGIETGKIIENIKQSGTINLKNVFLLNVYNLSDEEESLTFHLKFQSFKKTLNDKNVDFFVDKIIKTIGEKLNGRLR